MRITRITGASIDSEQETKIDFVDNENTGDAIVMSANVTAALIAELSELSHHLHTETGAVSGPTYELIGCQPIVTQDRQPGLLLAVKDGFEFVLLLPSQMLSALHDCIEHIQSNEPSH